MKKQYLKPEIENIKLELEGILRVSGDMDGEANEPARARMFNGGFIDDCDDCDDSEE